MQNPIDPESLAIIRDEIQKAVREAKSETINTIGLAAKIGGAAIGIAVAILTYVGYTKITDWQEVGTQRIDKFVKSEPAFQRLEGQLTNIRVRALIAYHRQIAATGEVDTLQEDISESDAQQILGTIKENDADDGTFAGAVEVLAEATGSPWWRNIEPSLLSLVEKGLIESSSSDGNETTGAELSIERRVAIAQMLAEAGSKTAWPSMRKMVGSSDTTAELIPAFLRLAEILDKEISESDLEGLFNRHRAEAAVEMAVMRSLSRWYPENKSFQAWLSKSIEAADVDALPLASVASRLTEILAQPATNKAIRDFHHMTFDRIVSVLVNRGYFRPTDITDDSDEVLLAFCQRTPRRCGTDRAQLFALETFSESYAKILDKARSERSADNLASFLRAISSIPSVAQISVGVSTEAPPGPVVIDVKGTKQTLPTEFQIGFQLRATRQARPGAQGRLVRTPVLVAFWDGDEGGPVRRVEVQSIESWNDSTFSIEVESASP
jgi:hypothetical protein